ncbi:hypothetical protein [Verrucomicrobium sp. BvORR106]|uniref:hypothetical protein n=1 Tax=Verrucomicrobium sp. BvORR106 TaxID=1403819 RepID=UPI00056F11F3|nr:hypothetical protein [Verrucomicrobium sp. BvORR106]
MKFYLIVTHSKGPEIVEGIGCESTVRSLRILVRGEKKREFDREDVFTWKECASRFEAEETQRVMGL